MTERTVSQCNIPDQEICPCEHMKNRHWFPNFRKTRYQDIDTKYQDFKKFLIDFFINGSDNTWLQWTSQEDAPITISRLDIESSGCCSCGVTCEVPCFAGKIRYEGKEYDYDCGVMRGYRWCECGREWETRTTTFCTEEEMLETLKESEFLLEIYIKNCPTAQFIRLYTSLDEMKVI